jgi:hypothetical protein
MRFELRSIVEGTRALPATTARRHHFVPAFALAQFGDPPGHRKAQLFQLDVQTSQTQRTSPDDAAFERELYTYGPAEERVNKMESFLSIVEKHAARALATLRENPERLTPQDRETIAYFLAFQEGRTPTGIARREQMQQASMELQFGVELATPEGFRKLHRERVGGDATPDEIEAQRLRMQAQLEGGKVTHEEPRGMAIKLMLETVHDVAQTVYQLDWIVLEATGAEFVTSDRAIGMDDPTLEFPWCGHAWASSPNAVTFHPLSPNKGLLLTPGDCGLSAAPSKPRQVRRLNLLTYGWAERRIFGRRRQTLMAVRQQAERYPDEVIRPRPTKQAILEEADPTDPLVGADHARRGWPRALVVTGEDGRDRLMSYTVVDEKARPGDFARASAGAARRVTAAAKPPPAGSRG